MHGTHIPIRTWVFVIYELCSNKNGVAAREIERRYDLTPKTAWFLLHRIREAMAHGPGAELFSGVVVADETWIGGAPKNRHAHQRVGSKEGLTDKTPVVTLVHKESGKVRSKVVANVNGPTLRKVLEEGTIPGHTHLHTDAAPVYARLGPLFASHGAVDHSAGEYVRDGISTNLAENYFSQLKRSITGTHHHVSKQHLHRYVGEFDFRHGSHEMTDTERVGVLMGRVAGRRLMYSDSFAGA